MAAINLATLGIHLYYAVETTVGELPTTRAAFKDLEGVKSIPSLNPAPDTIETTTLNELEWKTYVDGLKDLGGALEFTFNLTNSLIDMWETLMEEYATAKAAGKQTWFFIDVPDLKNGFYFPGNPSNMGLPEAAVNSVLEITNYITPVGAPKSAPKPLAA